jgi:DNA polymerase (family 10)
LFAPRRRHPEEVAAILTQLALLARWSRHQQRAVHLEGVAERLRTGLRANRRASWASLRDLVQAAGPLPRWLNDLVERLRMPGIDEVDAALRTLPPVTRALSRAALDHPALASTLDAYDLLLPADIDRVSALRGDTDASSELDALVGSAPPGVVPLGRAWQQTTQAIEELSDLSSHGTAWERAGAIRRTEPLAEDVVLLAATGAPAEWVRDVTTALPESALSYAGRTALALATEPEPLVVYAVTPEALPAALLWYTGPRAHVAELRARSASQGLHLHAQGLDRHGAPMVVRAEADVYKALDLAPIPVELRHRPESIAQAATGSLPDLVDVTDIRGDLHMHTVWSDGRDSMTSMVHAARALGYEYIAITDHSPLARASRVLTLERLAKQADEVAAVRQAFPDLTILHGIEVDIQSDGSLDVPDAMLATLDIVLASLHEGHGHSPARLLERYGTAARHPLVNVLTHPANRAPGRASGYALDFRRLFEVAAESGTAIEIDGAPGHLDLDAPLAEEAAAAGAVIVVDSDCHVADRLGRQMAFGVGLARRAALRPDQVLNTRDVGQVRAFVSAKRAGRRW